MDTSDFKIEVAPVDLGYGELGLIAKEDMEAGDILAWAPKSNLLTADKALAIWGEGVAALPGRLLVALLLVRERFMVGRTSQWATYIDALPGFDGDVSGPSFLWGEEEMNYLEGSDCYGASIAMRENFLDEYDDLKETLFDERPEEFPPDIFTLNNFMWSVAVVASRAYGDDEEGSNLAIAPLVDFLNHRAGALQLTRFSNGIVAYAHKKYRKGDQVWVNYGGKSNAQLLSQYGFVDDGNDYEAVFLRVGPHMPEIAGPHADAKRRLLAELLDEEMEPDSAIFKLSLRPRDWEARLVPALRILSLPENIFVPVTVRELVPVQPAEHEAAAWSVLVDAIDRRLAEYPESTAEAKAILAKGGKEMPERQSLGIRLRISEQELLELARTQAVDRRDFALSELGKAAADAAPAAASADSNAAQMASAKLL